MDRNQLIQDMDNQVLQFGTFTWEIGEGVEKPLYFCISPGGNPEKLAITSMIMAEAPPQEHWELHPGKPARKENLVFSLFDQSMTERTVDATEWHFSLVRHSASKVIAILEAPNIEFLDPTTQQDAGEFTVTNLLGEATRIYHVHRISVVNELMEHFQEDKHPIHQLRGAVLAMLQTTDN